MRYDGETAPQVIETYFRDVNTIDVDGTGAGFEEAEESESEGGFSCSCAADYAYALVLLDDEGEAFKNWVEVWSVGCD